jgi:RNA polymerase sigma-70 factor (ECF subfamily)
MSDDSDRALLARVARGDEAAHRVLFDAYYSRVFAFTLRRLRDAPLCEEIVDDVFFEVWRSAERFAGRSRVSSWIFGIAQFKCMAAARDRNRLKRSSVRPMVVEALHAVPDQEVLEEVLQMRDELRTARDLLEALPRGQRDVIVLAVFEDLPYEEIAERLGISTGTVKSRIARARGQLRAGLGRSAGGVS